MNRLKMDITKTDNNVPAPQKGDDGEAVLKIAQMRAKSSSSLECSAECSKFSAKIVQTSAMKACFPIAECSLSSSKIKQYGAFEVENELKMPDDAGWYVAVVRCNCENTIGKAIELHFQKHKIWFEYWVPMRKEVVIDKRSNKRRVKEKVLLTTFIFCHVSPDHLDTIRFRPDVYKMLTMPGYREIYRISDKELNDYRRLVENPDLPVSPCSGPLRKGQKVRITEGKMAGLEAYVQRLSGKKVLIGNEIKYVSGATIEIDRSFLETVE